MGSSELFWVYLLKLSILKHFKPYHTDLEIVNSSELLLDEITKKVEEAAGTKDNVRSADFVEGKQVRGYTANSAGAASHQPPPGTVKGTYQDRNQTPSRPTTSNSAKQSQPNLGKPMAPIQSQTVAFSQTMVNAISSVRDDNSKLNW